MTRLDYCRAMLLDYAHPDLWSERDRDAYLRWRLTDVAEWARRIRPDGTGWVGALSVAAWCDEIHIAIGEALSERWSLYRPRYKRCQCDRCAPKIVNPFFDRVRKELAEIEAGIRARRGMA